MKITRTEKFVAAATIAIIIGMIATIPRAVDNVNAVIAEYTDSKSVDDENAWSGWVKSTGNPKGLTKEEWLALENKK